MARKKKHEEHENHERWLVSYADFITLLFAFFVVMYSISSVNDGKYRVLSDSLVAAFNETKKSFEPIQVGEIVKSATNASIEIVSKPTLIKVPIVTLSNQDADKGNLPGAGFTSSPENARDIQKIADEVAEAMQQLVDMGLVAISVTDLWVEVDIKDSVLFLSGSARIRQEAIEVLTRVAAILADFTNPVRVEGFTDNVPINTPVYPSNWELSAARASSVVRLFEGLNISSSRLSAVGYGEYRPVAANDTVDGRAKNRRVVLVVLADKEVEYLLDERLRQSAVTEEAGSPASTDAAPPATEAAPPTAPLAEDSVPLSPAGETETPDVPPAAAPGFTAPAPAAPPAEAPAAARTAPVQSGVKPPRPPNPRPQRAITLPPVLPALPVRPLELAPPAAQPRVEISLPPLLPRGATVAGRQPDARSP